MCLIIVFDLRNLLKNEDLEVKLYEWISRKKAEFLRVEGDNTRFLGYFCRRHDKVHSDFLITKRLKEVKRNARFGCASASLLSYYSACLFFYFQCMFRF